ncbi:hypothetical protein FGO68_gene744 [Halteria grandinella]|uniref:Uncharacterized protein n=1 Tax=Halteria grandinella TaxID=5974 RepID=A0A8J8T5G5_HALGN|nr:hypothetical protein FGO68_gene744 [Halteria grandinella]
MPVVTNVFKLLLNANLAQQVQFDTSSIQLLQSELLVKCSLLIQERLSSETILKIKQLIVGKAFQIQTEIEGAIQLNAVSFSIRGSFTI